jgi:putative hydrolase of the HAD superfamily
MTYSTLILDLDDTLYPSSTGIWDLIGDRINLFIHERIGMPANQVSEKRERLFHQYGTTLRGLQIEYGIDPQEYLDFVHQVPIEEILSPDPALNQLLTSIPLTRWIFTNASRAHAERVLGALQIDSPFAGIIDILDIAPFCKPMPEAFELAFRKAAITDPKNCILVDDTPRNIAAARSLGLYTIQVGIQPAPDAHAHISSIHQLSQVLPQETIL